MAADQTIRVYTNQVHEESGGFSFGSSTAIWNDKGDTGKLLDAEGNEVSNFTYSDSEPFKANVEIGSIFYHGSVKRTQSDEYIEIRNIGNTAADLSNWKVTSTGKNQVFTFPEGTSLGAGRMILVYTNEVHEETGGFSFGSSTAIWNDKGDTGTLLDAEGNEVSSFSYGDVEPLKANVEITDISYKGDVKRTQSDEYVEIGNSGNAAADLSNWKVTSTGKNQIFTFPEGTSLAANQTIRVYTDQVHEESGGFSFGSSTAIWNDQGDTGKLLDAKGNEVSSFSYENS